MMPRRRTTIVCFTLLVALAFIALPVSAAASMAFPVLDNQVEIRQAHLRWAAAVQETKMQAAVEYIEGLDGSDTSDLEGYLGDFEELSDQIGDLDTHIGLNNAIRQMVQLGIQYRLELLRQMRQGHGSWSGLRAAINAAEEGNSELDALKNAYQETRMEKTLAIYDTQVARAEQVLDLLSEKGYDVTEAQCTLDRIEDKRDELQAALQAGDTAAIRSLQREILELSRDLAAQVRDLQIRVPEGKRVQFWITVGERALERAGMVKEDLEDLGIDTSSLAPFLEEAKEDLDAAGVAHAAGDLEAAKDALLELRQDFRDLAQAYRDLIRGEDLTPAVKDKVDTLTGTLEATAGEMGSVE